MVTTKPLFFLGIGVSMCDDIVKIDTAIGTVSATISRAAVAELGLAVGADAAAVVKATSVMVGIE